MSPGPPEYEAGMSITRPQCSASRCRQENNIKMGRREKGWESVDWIHMAQDRPDGGLDELNSYLADYLVGQLVGTNTAIPLADFHKYFRRTLLCLLPDVQSQMPRFKRDLRIQRKQLICTQSAACQYRHSMYKYKRKNLLFNGTTSTTEFETAN
jgi:hypothetical protein